MATNKRKDSAALFELIGKSTLKVPKSAGALKIPNWWSSKTGSPAGEGAAEGKVSPKPVRNTVTTPIAKTKTTEDGALSHVGSTAERECAAKVAEVPAQHRLFDPPPANITPERTPSIRPPAPVGGMQAAPMVAPSIKPPRPEVAASEGPVAVEAGPAGTTPAETAPVEAAAEPVADSTLPDMPMAVGHDVSERTAAPPALPPWESKPKVPVGPRVFAPQTRAQDRTAWSPRPGAFARLPAWIWPTAAGVGLLLIVGVVAIAKSMNKSRATKPQPVAEIPTSPNPTLVQGGGRRAGGGATPGPQKMIFYPGEFAHSPELYYIIVCTTPADTSGPQPKISKAAMEYAKWLADHGIAVSIELVQSKPGAPFMNVVVSAFGLPSATAAEPYRKEIVQKGDLLKRGVFKDAHVQNGLSSPGTAPTRALGMR